MFVHPHEDVEDIFQENDRFSRMLAGADRQLTSLPVETEAEIEATWNDYLELGDEQSH